MLCWTNQRKPVLLHRANRGLAGLQRICASLKLLYRTNSSKLLLLQWTNPDLAMLQWTNLSSVLIQKEIRRTFFNNTETGQNVQIFDVIIFLELRTIQQCFRSFFRTLPVNSVSDFSAQYCYTMSTVAWQCTMIVLPGSHARFHTEIGHCTTCTKWKCHGFIECMQLV